MATRPTKFPWIRLTDQLVCPATWHHLKEEPVDYNPLGNVIFWNTYVRWFFGRITVDAGVANGPSLIIDFPKEPCQWQEGSDRKIMEVLEVPMNKVRVQIQGLWYTVNDMVLPFCLARREDTIKEGGDRQVFWVDPVELEGWISESDNGSILP